MSDKDLTPEQTDIAKLSIRIAEAISDPLVPDLWVEDMIPPMSEDDVLSSCLVDDPHELEPVGGFNLWAGINDEKLYRVTVRRMRG